MKRLYSIVLAILLVVTLTTVSIATSSFSISTDKAVYSPGTYMTIEISAPSSGYYTVEILKGNTIRMTLPESGSQSKLEILIPADWPDGTDYTVRVGRGVDIASVGFTIS